MGEYMGTTLLTELRRSSHHGIQVRPRGGRGRAGICRLRRQLHEHDAAQIKAQFESVMKEVTMKKHKYAMGVMTEFASMCECLGSSTATYQTMFVENAKTLNMTDIMDLNQWNAVKPYESKTLKEAKERLF